MVRNTKLIDLIIKLFLGEKKKLLFIFIFIVLSCSIYAQEDKEKTFAFQYTNYDKYRIETTENTIIQYIYQNDVVSENEVTINSNIIVNILSREKDAFTIEYDIETVNDGRLVTEEKSKFSQYSSGHVVVPRIYDAPYSRSIPQFPSNILKKGDIWTYSGKDNIKFPEANSFKLVDVNVNYEYLGYGSLPQEALFAAEKKDISLLKEAPMVKINYEIEPKTYFNTVITQQQKFSAEYEIIVWWNFEDSRIEYYYEEYAQIFEYEETGEVFLINGKTSGWVLGITDLDKNVENIRKQLPNVEITQNDKGITFSIQNIQFLSDSSLLQESEQVKLNTIAMILKRYKNRRVLVEGHTALAGTENSRAQLSVARARAVVNYIKRVSKIDKDLFLYRGWGAKKPLESNFTEEGREKNRRVVITVLEN